jgi:hypothetical protein
MVEAGRHKKYYPWVEGWQMKQTQISQCNYGSLVAFRPVRIRGRELSFWDLDSIPAR